MFVSKLASAVVVALWVSSTLCEGVASHQGVQADIGREISDRNSKSRRGPSRIEVRNVVYQDNVVAARQAASPTKQGSSAPVATPKNEPETSKDVVQSSKPTVAETTAPPVEENTVQPVVAAPTPKPVEAATTSSPPPAVVQAPPTTSSSSPTAAAPDAASTNSKKSSSSSAPNPATTWPTAGDTNRDGLNIYKTQSQSPTTTDRYRISRTIRTNAIAQATEQIQPLKSDAGSVRSSRTWRGSLLTGFIAMAAVGL